MTTVSPRTSLPASNRHRPEIMRSTLHTQPKVSRLLNPSASNGLGHGMGVAYQAHRAMRQGMKLDASDASQR